MALYLETRFNCSEKWNILFGLCSSWTWCRCLPAALNAHIVVLWFNLLAIRKATPGFHFKFPLTVYFFPLPNGIENREETKVLWGNNMNICKGQSIWSFGILFIFFMRLSVAKSCEGVRNCVWVCACVCVHACGCVYKWKSMCVHKGCSSRFCVCIRATACISLRQPQSKCASEQGIRSAF